MLLARVLAAIRREWFLLGMGSAVLLATIFPDFGAKGGAMHADMAANLGISCIFLFHGMALSTQNLRDGMSRWKLHLLVQVVTFVIFPLLWFPFRLAFGSLMPDGLMLGFLYLCALPSTISSSVAMTAIAKGNVPAAIFNATLSSLIGIFLTPAIVSLVTGLGGGASLPLGRTIANIALLLLLPFAVGQALRPLCAGFMRRYKKYIGTFDKLVIIMLVYGTFCESVKSGLWRNYGLDEFAVTLGGAALFLGLGLALSSWLARRVGLPVEDRITAIFCGSKKTLAAGVPMAGVLFAANPALGMIVLPIMFYHPLQLFVCSILANRFAKRLSREAPIEAPATFGQAVPSLVMVKASGKARG